MGNLPFLSKVIFMKLVMKIQPLSDHLLIEPLAEKEKTKAAF